MNPLPKFQSVPAAPQFIDLAGAYIKYPDLGESLNKYKAAGGLFKKLTGFFGRSWGTCFYCVWLFSFFDTFLIKFTIIYYLYFYFIVLIVSFLFFDVVKYV